MSTKHMEMIKLLFSKDISMKILNKLSLYDLQMFLGSDLGSEAEYFKFRALELYGISNLSSPYISTYEKYIQLAAFNLEIGWGSERHVPAEKCLIIGIRDRHEILCEHFSEKASFVLPLEILNACNLEMFKSLDTIEPIKWIEYSKSVDPKIYEYIFKLPSSELVGMSLNEYIIGAMLPIDSIKDLKTLVLGEEGFEDELLDETFGDIRKIILAAQSTMDIDRVTEILDIFDWTMHPLYEYYVRDDPKIPANLVSYLFLEGIIYYACSNILSKFGPVHSNLDFYSIYEHHCYVSKIPKSRMREFFEVLKDFKDDHRLKNAIEYWSWILYTKSSVKVDGDFEPYKITLDIYFKQLGNPEKICKWIAGGGDPTILDLIKFPQYIDRLLESKFVISDLNKLYRYFRNCYNPKLWLKIYNLQKNDLLVPTADLAKKLSTLVRIFPPEFLEPRKCWESLDKLSLPNN